MYGLALLLFCVPSPVRGVSQIFTTAECSSTYFLCDPPGTTTVTLGQVGPAWGSLYTDLINAVGVENNSSAVTQTVNPTGPVKREQAFCCSMTTDCMLVENYKIAVCWDQFTTNVFFPDGTYGNIVSGQFTTADGNAVDVVYGNYTLADGEKGNIYDSNESQAPPNTSTLTMPTPFTSSGIGSAIPATQLGTTGILSTITTTIPATTNSPTTKPSITITEVPSGCTFCLHNGTTIAGPTLSGGSNAAITSIYSTGILPSPYIPHNGGVAVVTTVSATSVFLVLSALAMMLS